MTEVLVKCGFENFVLRILNYKLNPNTFSKKEKKKLNPNKFKHISIYDSRLTAILYISHAHNS